ncbi:hypothetical protein GGF45_003448 [Coemansia sp. RSA 551]|nr:hypothetical protein GGF45_003448 [Coemansia sp. RSA 551]
MANPPLMVKRGNSAQIGQTNIVQLCLALICAAFCIAYIRGFKHTWMLHKQIQDFFTLPHDTWATEPAVEATDNIDQAECAPAMTYIATAAQITEPAVTNQEELLDSDMVQHKRVFRGNLKAKLRSVGKASKLTIKFRRGRHAN